MKKRKRRNDNEKNETEETKTKKRNRRNETGPLAHLSVTVSGPTYLLPGLAATRTQDSLTRTFLFGSALPPPPALPGLAATRTQDSLPGPFRDLLCRLLFRSSFCFTFAPCFRPPVPRFASALQTDGRTDGQTGRQTDSYGPDRQGPYRQGPDRQSKTNDAPYSTVQ